jgi:hypothetical protein
MKDLPKIINTRSLIGSTLLNGKYYYNKNKDIFVIKSKWVGAHYPNVNNSISQSVIRFELNHMLNCIIEIRHYKYINDWYKIVGSGVGNL